MGAGEPFRETGRHVYDGGAGGHADGAGGAAAGVRQELEAACWRDGGVDDEGRVRHMLTFDRAPEAFTPIGGALAWKGLLAHLGRTPPFG